MGYFNLEMPLWEKVIWILLFAFLIIVLVVFWFIGWSHLGLVG